MFFDEIANNGFTTTKIISAYTIFTEKVTSDMIALLQSSDTKLLKSKLQELEDICNESGGIDVNLKVSLNAQKEQLKVYYNQLFKTKMTPGAVSPESDKTEK